MDFSRFFTLTTGAESDKTLIFSTIEHMSCCHSVKSNVLTPEVLELLSGNVDNLSSVLYLEPCDYEDDCYICLPEVLKSVVGEFTIIKAERGAEVTGSYEKIVYFDQ